MHSFADRYGKHRCTVLVNHDSIRIFLVDQADSLEKEFNLARHDDEEVRGGFINGDKIYIFCGNKVPHGLHNYVINMDDRKFTQNLVVSNGGKGVLIDRINAGDCYLVFSIYKKTSEFIISKWSGPDSAEITSYPIDDKDIWDEITEIEGFNREMKITKVDEAGLPGLDVVVSQRKLYLVHDTVFLLVNRNRGFTKVFAFDFRRKTVSSRIIVNEEIEEHGGYKDNSYLSDGKLYFASATADRLNIAITDFYSGLLLKKYSANREDTINFKNTEVSQEGAVYGFGYTKDLTKTRQLLRKMTAGNAVIAVLKDSLGIGITIGSNKEMYTASSGGGSFVPGNFGTGGPGTMTYVPSGGFSSSSWNKTVRFRMLIDSIDMNHIPGEMEPGINERIEKFNKELDIPDNAKNLVFHDGKYLYTYYDKKERSLVFCHFSY